MNKIKKDVRIDYQLDWCDWYDGVEIKKIISDLIAIKELGATNIHIKHGLEDDMTYVDVFAVQKRLETDEEYTDRINRTVEFERKMKAKELELLRRLKSKYEDK